MLRATRGGIAPEVAGGSYVIVTLSGVTMPPFAHVACCAEVATLSEDGLLIDVSLPLDAIVVTPGARPRRGLSPLACDASRPDPRPLVSSFLFFFRTPFLAPFGPL